MADWTDQLRAKGYRLTPQRQLVLEAVGALEHATPETILTRVRRTAGGVNLSTVYRTLELLEELGLVTHTHLGHGSAVYHPATEPDHLHLVCRNCGTVIEAPASAAAGFVAKLRAEYGFRVDAGHFAIYGTCKNCV